MYLDVDDIRFKILAKEQRKLAEKFMEKAEACPYCGSEETEEDDMMFDGPGIRAVTGICNECGKTWGATYVLAAIETDELAEKGLELIPEAE